MGQSLILVEEIESDSGKMIGHVCLNARDTLNALSLDMIDQLSATLTSWQSNDDVVCVILSGSGDKAFCAGGDVKNLYQSIIDCDYGDNAYASAFFSREYRLDYQIHTYGKPLICWGSGIIMGGGMGLMAGASHRVVTESTMMAMPEVTIGLFPDVGGSWFLNKMPGRLGLFVGLTGVRMKAADALYARLADYYLDAMQWDGLLQALIAAPWHRELPENHQQVSDILSSLASEPDDDSSLQTYQPLIDSLLDVASPADALANLTKPELPAWFSRPAQTLATGSPVSAWLVFEQLRRGKGLSLADIFRMELTMAIQCTRHRDFAEGVRALLIQRTNDPGWRYPSIEDVPMAQVDEYFSIDWPESRHPLADL
ncbi:enoyl-CoA hydratase/isomerase family protein [Kistimonas scapharcae]|uniref:3-hydroxyisobutyryl-CoA hydrolase n=1 Tax=Kistimonas scapharcae TaxID=1036133 RepID=A0ABP8UXU8_9GAMM